MKSDVYMLFLFKNHNLNLATFYFSKTAFYIIHYQFLQESTNPCKNYIFLR